MQEEYEKKFASWFAEFITQTQRLDYESICKKAFMAGVKAAQQSMHLTGGMLPVRKHFSGL